MTELSTLVRYVEDYLDLTREARALAERDRDYYDGIQLTSEEIATLQQRRQPPVIFNRIKPKIDTLLGFERSQRTDPKAYPRTPQHEQDADGVTDALRYVCDDQRWALKRSSVAENLFIEGAGGVMVGVEPNGFDVSFAEIPWDRLFYDPHSTKRDFSDCKYKGVMVWMDDDDAETSFQGKEAIIASALSPNDADTFDDKPKTAWADTKRKRIRVAHIYYREGGREMTAIFTKVGFLREPQVSPYLDEDGQPTCPIELASAYVDRDNNRYGVVRQHIHPQDEINKRRSKMLHLLNVNRVILEEGAVKDIRELRAELAKPDGVIVKTPGMELEILPSADLSQGQAMLLQEAKNEIDNVGVNPALAGKAGGIPSGRAQEMQTQAGLMELSVVFDSIKDLSLRVYRQAWLRIRQYWTEERWIRVTDDEQNVKWVGLNRPGAMPVAQMDVDILIEDAPDSVNIQSEQFEILSKMFQAAPDRIPFEAVIQASNLRNKRQILDGNKPDPKVAAEQQNVAHAQAVAEVEKTQSETIRNFAEAEAKQHGIVHQQTQAALAAELGQRQPVVSTP